MKTKILVSFGLTVPMVTPMFSIISCSSTTSDYKVMDFKFSKEKIQKISDVQAFNNEKTTIDKLLKLVFADDVNQLDRYTKEAMEKELFQSIKINKNESKKKIVVEVTITNKKIINNKTIYYSYRLPNSSLNYSYTFYYD